MMARAPVRLPRDLRAMESLVRDEGVGLLILDPLIAFLSERVAVGHNQGIRRVLSRLAGLADRTGAAVVMVRHLNKSDGQKAMYRGTGAIGIIGSARSALLVATDPYDPGRCVLTATKANLTGSPTGLGYRIVGTPAGQPVIEWLGPVRLTSDEALSGPVEAERVEVGMYQAAEWLLTALKAGPRPAAEVVREALAAGISERTLERAKKEAKVVSELKYSGDDREWIWKVYKPLFPPLPELW